MTEHDEFDKQQVEKLIRADQRIRELEAERDRFRVALERIAYPDSQEVAILDEASELAKRILNG